MRRHVLKPIPRGNPGARGGPSVVRQGIDGMDWSKLDRVQVLGSGRADEGHTGCVNALSWSDDGDVLLSGSDDKRVCIWTPDTSSAASSSSSPHPMKLSTAIRTGHGANIFSAKFLPNAGTPTVVTVAGDHEIRLLEIERLSASGHHPGRWEHGGAGVKVLKCHRDRTKRIATENSPSLFMTVSEDGTVRQHDLRRPHRCRSECPDPLFRAPQGVDLYSLSVSTPAPHIFAVAGRTDTAFICDRRMLEKHNPSWGNRVVGSGQVHCVRRLGLPDSEWDKSQPTGVERMFTGERHITCVKMSPEHADEAIVSFQRHSTSLFSIYDDPGTSSARRSASPILPPNEGGKSRRGPVDPTVELAERRPTPIKKQNSTKRKKLNIAEQSMQSASTKEETGDEANGTGWEDAPIGGDSVGVGGPRAESDVELNADSSQISSSAILDDPDLIQDLQDEDIRDLMNLDEDTDGADEISISSSVIDDIFTRALGPPINSEHPTANDRFDDIDRAPPDFDDDMYDDDDHNDYDEFDEDDEDQDGGNVDFELFDDDYADYQDFEEEFGDEYEDEDDYEDMDDDMFDDEDPPMFPDRRSADTELGGVEMIYPKRIFKGAKNIETVKDCNFLGLRSDKVCSGSDDGHFFVWDKDTGRLEGIWEGDGSIVNVMEQHPTLPIVAVSGIDDTIKMFAPTMTPPNPSFVRTHLKDRIILNNTDPDRMHSRAALNRLSIMQLFGAQGVMPRADDPEDDGGPVRPNCETQ